MKIICVGLNYQSHKEEMKRTSVSTLDGSPVLFLKPDTALLTDDKCQFYIPDFANNVHYEAEVVVRINKMGKNISERFAHRYYSEVTIGIDLTARDLQTQLKEAGLPWEISKAFDNSAVIGDYVSKDKLDCSVDNMNFHLLRNGTTVQSANTSQLIYSIDRIIAYASRFFTLKTGDLIFTGTPAGVGKIEIGDRLQGFLENSQLLDLEIC